MSKFREHESPHHTGTLAENIAYGNPLATRTEMEKAAKAARADQFIEKLPEGYDTVIADQGVKLSGGRRQRLSLADRIVEIATLNDSKRNG